MGVMGVGSPEVGESRGWGSRGGGGLSSKSGGGGDPGVVGGLGGSGVVGSRGV